MLVLKVGSVCIKKAGSEKGSLCVVTDIIDNNFVEVTGPKSLTGVKRRRVNISHLEITDKNIEIPKGAPDDLVLKKIEESGLKELFMKK